VIVAAVAAVSVRCLWLRGQVRRTLVAVGTTTDCKTAQVGQLGAALSLRFAKCVSSWHVVLGMDGMACGRRSWRRRGQRYREELL
jgi:hypothetical protein